MIDLSRYFGPNAGYVAELYDRYLRDPNSVDLSTRRLFEGAGLGGTAATNGAVVPSLAPAPAAQPAPAPAVTAGPVVVADATTIAGVVSLARSIRVRGHLAAQTDPLGKPPKGDPTLDPAYHRVTEAQLERMPADLVGGYFPNRPANALEAINELRRIYVGPIGYEFIHVQVPDERRWLAEAVESQRFCTPLSTGQRRVLLERLSQVEGFERYLHRTFPGQRRFSIEGTDMLVPMLDELVARAAEQGTREIVMGMAHRGRLNVLAHILGKPYRDIIKKFHSPEGRKGTAASESAGEGFSGDVKYHLGARSTYRGTAVQVNLTMAHNPSHLEFVNPVVEGMARASQDRLDRRGKPRQDEDAALPIVMHGDAAFPGQGVVAETLNLSALEGYRTGGTLHIIVNNQIGFTTDPTDARSTHYASDLAKGFEIPIVHVNADDAEACLAAARLAAAYRYRFHKDFLIDLVGYRRWGHNEGDEPAYTQPKLYQAVQRQPTVREQLAERLIGDGVISSDDAAAMLKRIHDTLDADRRSLAEAHQPAAHANGNVAVAAIPSLPSATAIPVARLRELNEYLLETPTDFRLNPKLARPLSRRRQQLEEPGGIEWAHAETLAFASILSDGTPIRLTGQDAERGTFSQRHLVLHDPENGSTYTPLQELRTARAAFALFNSPLSENAALGFEYGYSVQAPRVLVLWEAQFGDFANGGQVIVDQFIAAALAKWGQHPALVLLLPHGNEGQGPEHSSARLERFLQLAADGNMSVANPTTSSQYFHLLRAQALSLAGGTPRPLVLMTPKSLLRQPRAGSSLDDLANGRFRPVIDDTVAGDVRRGVRRLVLCSGKVWVDLMKGREERETAATEGVSVARLEQFYPFPADEVAALLAGYPALDEVVWLQEEPRNMGAWAFVAPRLREVIDGRFPLKYLGRPDRSSPAEGSTERFEENQSELVAAAFALDRAAAAPEKDGVVVYAD